MRQPKRYVGNALLTGALVLGTGAAVVADDRQGLYFDETADHGSERVAAELEDETLHRFVDAAHDVRAIRERYAALIDEAEPQDRAALQARAQEEMMEAVERQGLEVAEYREIGYLLETDDSLGDRLDRVAG